MDPEAPGGKGEPGLPGAPGPLVPPGLPGSLTQTGFTLLKLVKMRPALGPKLAPLGTQGHPGNIITLLEGGKIPL